MQFVAFEARDPVKDIDEAKRNPFLSRDDMRAVLARSLSLYQSRNGGALPKRLVIHKTTAFKGEEAQGALDALHGVKEVECIEISSRSSLARGLVDYSPEMTEVNQEGRSLSLPDTQYPEGRSYCRLAAPRCYGWLVMHQASLQLEITIKARKVFQNLSC